MWRDQKLTPDRHDLVKAALRARLRDYSLGELSRQDRRLIHALSQREPIVGLFSKEDPRRAQIVARVSEPLLRKLPSRHSS